MEKANERRTLHAVAYPVHPGQLIFFSLLWGGKLYMLGQSGAKNSGCERGVKALARPTLISKYKKNTEEK